MRINYNVSAMLSNNALANNDSLLAKSLERLSSGLKINHAKDNPAGLAMAKRMNAQIEGVSAASQNASDGVSIIEIADGALSEVSEMLQRMNELSIKASNGTMLDEDRETVQSEISQLMDEINRVADTTEFNGQSLLNGEFNSKGYTDKPGVTVNSYSENVAVKTYKIKNLDVSRQTVNGKDVYALNNFVAGSDFPQDTTAEMKDSILTIKGNNGFEMTLDLADAKFGATGNLNLDGMSVEAMGIGAMRLQVGANEGQVLSVGIPAMNLRNLGIETVDVSTAESAQEAISRIDGAIKYVAGVRGKLGAYQNRLESTINSLDITSENMTAAYSRIMDVDMAEETTNFATYQVLTQAGTSMLAQANERPSQVLQLLQ